MEVTNISGFIMDKDRKVVEIKNDKILFIDQKFAPLHFVYGKSIETWLRGTLKSFCSEHKWERGTDKLSEEISKYSAFNEDNDEDEYDDVEGANEN